MAVPRSAPAQRTFLRRAGSAEWGYVHTTVSCSIAQAASNVDFSFRAGQVHKYNSDLIPAGLILFFAQTSLAEDIGADFNVEATVVSRLLSPMAFISDLVSVYLATKVSTYPLKSESLTAAGKAIMGHVTSYSALAAMSAKTFFSNFVNKEENKRFATPLEV